MRILGGSDGVDCDNGARRTSAPARSLPQVLQQAQDQQSPETEENASRDEGKRVSAHRSSMSFEWPNAVVTIRASPATVNALLKPPRENRLVNNLPQFMSATLSLP